LSSLLVLLCPQACLQSIKQIEDYSTSFELCLSTPSLMFYGLSLSESEAGTYSTSDSERLKSWIRTDPISNNTAAKSSSTIL